jgi:hypothetical protein
MGVARKTNKTQNNDWANVSIEYLNAWARSSKSKKRAVRHDDAGCDDADHVGGIVTALIVVIGDGNILIAARPRATEGRRVGVVVG